MYGFRIAESEKESIGRLGNCGIVELWNCLILES
jgi:hypothetical protein